MTVAVLSIDAQRATRGPSEFSTGTMEIGSGGDGYVGSGFQFAVPDLAGAAIHSATLAVRARFVDSGIYEVRTKLGIANNAGNLASQSLNSSSLVSHVTVATNAYSGSADYRIGSTYESLGIDVGTVIGDALAAGRLGGGYAIFLWQCDGTPSDFALVEADGIGDTAPITLTIDYTPAGPSLDAETITLTLVGQAAGLRAARQIAPAHAALSLSGQAAGLLHHHVLAADAGLFVLGGQAAELVAGGAYLAERGLFVLSGQAANLTYARRLVAETGVLSLTGPTTGLPASRRLTADHGSLALSGQTATLMPNRVIAAATGTIVVSGQPASLVYDQHEPSPYYYHTMMDAS